MQELLRSSKKSSTFAPEKDHYERIRSTYREQRSWYSVYCNEQFPFGFFGEGATIEEAERDFLATFEAFRDKHKARTGEDVQATFTFVKDVSVP